MPAGSFLRAIALEYQGSPLSAIGSAKRGGRYNPRTEFEILYLARHPDTVVREIKLVSRDVDGNEIILPTPPQLLLTVTYHLQCVVDLSSADGRKQLGVTKAELLREWTDDVDAGIVPYTHAIGRAARAAGVEAIIVPSARKRGEPNLAIIIDQLRTGSYVEIHDPRGFGPDVVTRVDGSL